MKILSPLFYNRDEMDFLGGSGFVYSGGLFLTGCLAKPFDAEQEVARIMNLVTCRHL
jgi:hypothetical protein